MSRLFQIQLANKSTYITRESSIEEFYKSRFYKLKRGCVVILNEQGKIQLYDLFKNSLFELSIYIQSNCINEIKLVIKNSELEKLYLKVTSGIILN